MKRIVYLLILLAARISYADVSSSGLYDANGSPVVLGQSSMSGSLPMAISSNQSSIPVAATQSGTWSVTNSGTTNVTQFGSNNVVTGTGASGLGIPRFTVSNDSNILASQSGTWNITNVSGTVSLPTGASTSALQTTGNTTLSTISTAQTSGTQKTQVVDGSGNVQPSGDVATRGIFIKATDGTNTAAVKAASTAAIATDPALVVAISPNNTIGVSASFSDVAPATQNITVLDTGTSNLTGANGQVFYFGTPTTNSAATFSLASQGTVMVESGGLGTGTLVVEVSMDNQAFWLRPNVYQLSTQSYTNSFTAPFIAVVNTAGLTHIRVRSITAWSGSGTITVKESLNTRPITIADALPPGANVIGGVTQSGTWTSTVSQATAANLNATVVQGTSPWVENISQFGGSNVATGTGVSGSGIPRVTVANDSKVIAWDGTNTSSVKAASAQSALTDTALVVTGRPDNVGTPTQTSVSCAATSTTLLTAGSATMFLSIRNPTTSTVTIWINTAAAAAVAAAPSLDLPPGSEAYFSAEGSSFLPTSQINCISGGSASSVTIIYK